MRRKASSSGIAARFAEIDGLTHDEKLDIVGRALDACKIVENAVHAEDDEGLRHLYEAIGDDRATFEQSIRRKPLLGRIQDMGGPDAPRQVGEAIATSAGRQYIVDAHERTPYVVDLACGSGLSVEGVRHDIAHAHAEESRRRGRPDRTLAFCNPIRASFTVPPPYPRDYEGEWLTAERKRQVLENLRRPHTCDGRARDCKPCAAARRARELDTCTQGNRVSIDEALLERSRRVLTERDRFRVRAKIAGLREAGLARVVLRCPTGHDWQTWIAPSSESGVESPLCPTCGAYFWRWEPAAVQHDRIALIRWVRETRTSPPWLILAMQRASANPHFAALTEAARRNRMLAIAYKYSAAYRSLGMRILTLPIASQRLIPTTTAVRPNRTIFGELALSTSKEE